MNRYTFPVVRARRTHSGTCPNCGKKVTRTRTFEHTINPFNKNASGEPKDYSEVRADVNAEADKWVPDFTHCPAAGLPVEGERS